MKIKHVLLFSLIPLSLFATNVKKSVEYIEGKRLYQETCVSCHGVFGETNQDMQLTVKPRRLKESILSKSQMVKMISDGGHAWGAHSDIMPAFKYVFEEEQIENIALYITTDFNHQRNARVKKLLAESGPKIMNVKKRTRMGKKIFKRNCSLCHGVTGNGDSVYVEQSKENKQFLFPYDLTRIMLTEEQIFLYAKFGGHFWGTDKKDMPSWKKKYDDGKLKAVAEYINEKIKKTKN